MATVILRPVTDRVTVLDSGRILPPVPAADSPAARERHLLLLDAYWGDRWPPRLCGDLPCDACDRGPRLRSLGVVRDTTHESLRTALCALCLLPAAGDHAAPFDCSVPLPAGGWLVPSPALLARATFPC